MLAQLYNLNVLIYKMWQVKKKLINLNNCFSQRSQTIVNFSIMHAFGYSSILNNYILNLIALLIVLIYVFLLESFSILPLTKISG